MDVDTIINDITKRTDIILKDALETVENNFDFIESNDLLEPKKDYLILFDFLNTTINHFSNLDNKFYDDTLRKLQRDINSLYKLHQIQKENLDDMETIFTKKVLSKISLFMQMQKSFKELQRSTTVPKEDLAYVKNQYNEMKNIYLECFKEEYLEVSNYILSSLEIILNSKIYYLDRLLWINATNSPAILRSISLFDKKNQSFNSRLYLEARISVALPYTEDYKYLQKCLRIYK